MKMTNPDNDPLEEFFAAARSARPAPSDDLMARVLADAETAQQRPGTVGIRPRPGLWPRVMDAIGGWPALGGLTAATLAGLWVGIAPPAAVEEMTASLIGDEVSISLFSTVEELGAEGFFDG